MTDDQRYTRYAEKKAGTNNKFYEVEAIQEDGHVRYYFRWGRIGTKGQEKEQRATGFAYAKSVCDEQFNRKLNKGYREVTAMEALASAIEDVGERKTDGLPPIQIEIPVFGAGRSEDRLQKLARKWLDKLNLVRASYYDLSCDEKYKQTASVMRGFHREWKRICASKTHGSNMSPLIEEAVMHFFNQLDNADGVHSCVHFYRVLR